MDHLALLFSLYLALVGQLQIQATQNVTNTEWESYKLQYGKTYESPEVDGMRRAIYANTKQWIEQHQSEARGFSIGLNHLADWTHEERAALDGSRLLADAEARRKALTNTPEAERFLQAILDDNSTQVPDELDWRQVHGRVSKVKDQGNCGSSFAFGAVGALEGQERPRHNVSRLVELSAQQIVDCDRLNSGCEGGWLAYAYEYVKNQGGLDDNRSYPYHGSNDRCQFQERKIAMTNRGHVSLPFGDEQKLKQVVAKFGPVSVTIQATKWFWVYKRGIFDDQVCQLDPTALNHIVLIVGYGTDPNGDYWLVKNSWGVYWGEDGYIRMSRNRCNQCGIASLATIPTF